MIIGVCLNKFIPLTNFLKSLISYRKVIMFTILFLQDPKREVRIRTSAKKFKINYSECLQLDVN